MRRKKKMINHFGFKSTKSESDIIINILLKVFLQPNIASNWNTFPISLNMNNDEFQFEHNKCERKKMINHLDSRVNLSQISSLIYY